MLADGRSCVRSRSSHCSRPTVPPFNSTTPLLLLAPFQFCVARPVKHFSLVFSLFQIDLIACRSRVRSYSWRLRERGGERHQVMVVWGGNHRLLPLHFGADSSLEPLGRGFEAQGGLSRPRRAARKARRGMAASLMRERRRVSKLIHFKINVSSPIIFSCF